MNEIASISSHDNMETSLESIDELDLLSRKSREDVLKKEFEEDENRKRLAREAMEKQINLDIRSSSAESRGSSKNASPILFRKTEESERSFVTENTQYFESQDIPGATSMIEADNLKPERTDLRKTKSLGSEIYGAQIFWRGNSPPVMKRKPAYRANRNTIPTSPRSDTEMPQSAADIGESTPFLSSNANTDRYLLPDRSSQHLVEKQSVPSKESDLVILAEKVFSNWVNIFLIFAPLAFIANHNSWSAQAQFWISFLAMIPLACLLGDLTEELALHTNQLMGGLINATFGNAVEVVVAVNALKANEFRIVQASMIGSIYSNLLLVLGCSFFFGGIKHSEQSYNHMVATANMGLLCLSSIAFVLPTQFAESYSSESDEALAMSRVVASFLILMYMQLLFFQLVTHKKYFEDDEDEEEPEFSFVSALIFLVIITIFISELSNILVGSIDGFCASSGISKSFVGLIILPIVGNAVEHLTAVRSAMHNKMDLTMGVAIGSSTQISLFVAPLTVLIGWKMDKPMTLTFPTYEITLYVLSVLVVAILVANAKSNWLEGSVLISTYILVAIGFWYEKYDDMTSL